MTGRPGHSVKEAMRRFFTENPYEWLSMEDMVTKWNCSSRTIELYLRQLREDGVPIKCISVYCLMSVEAQQS